MIDNKNFSQRISNLYNFDTKLYAVKNLENLEFREADPNDYPNLTHIREFEYPHIVIGYDLSNFYIGIFSNPADTDYEFIKLDIQDFNSLKHLINTLDEVFSEIKK